MTYPLVTVEPLCVPVRGDGAVEFVGGFYAQWEWDVTELEHVSVGALQGILRDDSRAAYVRVIADLKRAGCDAVALSCTEIPLLITEEVSPLPILDSTRLLARAAVEVAIGERPMPARYGGPVAERMAAE